MENVCEKCGKELVDGKCTCCDKEMKSDLKFSNNGIINRAAIKEEAKKLLKNNLWTVWKPILVPSLITSIIGSLVGAIFKDNLDAVSIIGVLTNLLVLPMTVGTLYYILNFVRGKKLEVKEIFSFYDKFLLIFAVTFLVGLFVSLWSLLLIIPGIIAALSYSMVTYLLADSKLDNPMELIKESKRMMNGYKMNYFVFNLSFIGWQLLCVFIIPVIFVIPYMAVSNALYYEELRKIQTKVNN